MPEGTKHNSMVYSFAVRVLALLRYVRRYNIKLSQDRLLKDNYSPGTRKLIVFLTPGFDVVEGGIMSISSIYEETKKLKHIHGAETIMCTIPGDPLLLRYTQFNNRNYIYRFSQVLSYFQNVESLTIHIEYWIRQFLRHISIQDYLRLRRIKDVRFNIMIQNIEMLASMKDIEKLRRLGKLTCTTAHQRYSTLELRKDLGMPLHRLSVFISPEKYDRKKYGEKEDLMIVSPDPYPRKSEVLRLIARQIPRLRIQIINNLTYEEYKKIITKAKWALTFGEGCDGYFLETVFSGGVSFSVYNSKFFTEDFKSLRTVYDDYDILIQKICSDIKSLDNEVAYADYQKEQYVLCGKHYDYKEYVKNLKAFYREDYTFK